jgi:hypothetical protein
MGVSGVWELDQAMGEGPWTSHQSWDSSLLGLGLGLGESWTVEEADEGRELLGVGTVESALGSQQLNEKCAGQWTVVAPRAKEWETGGLRGKKSKPLQLLIRRLRAPC